MTKSRATLIFNPHAGSRDWDRGVANFVEFWRKRGWVIHVAPTSRPGHATALAAQAALSGHEIVFAAGGDGTLNEVANGLVHTETALAPLPVGTANSFAKELGLTTPGLLQPGWFIQTSKALAAGRFQQMDLGRCAGDRYWLLWASTGADGFVVHQIEPRPRWFKRLGPVGYFAKALWFLPSFKGIHGTVRVDDQTMEGDFLMVNVSNCRRYAGGELLLNRDGVLDDGLFEVWIFRGKRWPTLLAYTVDISLNTHRTNRNIQVLTGRHVEVQTESPAPFHLDAEPAGHTPLICSIAPRSLRILVPDTTAPEQFSAPGEPFTT